MSFFDRFRKPLVASSPPPELSASEHTPLLVTRCLDELALLYPNGWRELEIRARVENDAMSIDRVDVNFVATKDAANPGLENAHQVAIRGVRDETDLALLRQPGFDCTEPFSFAVASLAAYTIDPQLHVWRWPQAAHLFFGVRL